MLNAQPAGLYANGVRDWVQKLMQGRPVEGSVKRSLVDGLQSITVKVTGTELTLNDVYNALHSDCWSVSIFGEDLPVNQFIHNRFNIIQSDRGARSGIGSNDKHDNKSEVSSRSGNNSKFSK